MPAGQALTLGRGGGSLADGPLTGLARALDLGVGFLPAALRRRGRRRRLLLLLVAGVPRARRAAVSRVARHEYDRTYPRQFAVNFAANHRDFLLVLGYGLCYRTALLRPISSKTKKTRRKANGETQVRLMITVGILLCASGYRFQFRA
jgi:hypothetical protein